MKKNSSQDLARAVRKVVNKGMMAISGFMYEISYYLYNIFAHALYFGFLLHRGDDSGIS